MIRFQGRIDSEKRPVAGWLRAKQPAWYDLSGQGLRAMRIAPFESCRGIFRSSEGVISTSGQPLEFGVGPTRIALGQEPD